ncbi:class I SAM-dependent methyltransferase [Pseudoalteromonas sp. Of7M-16]|uniref:class I SAM-dependent methyltransferase n=1 Tax=Pseudoalteromonas sp. Of7M-16 TaxID=2917756 RepID=UPI001EF458BD|nr:class I SAM-dependent methyltransferase [Pseudoalteromonas sp. Of7M-16]MCG7549881.1 class I SAM-dependent methyltransferase [Pseudoalteromonas sp. Of7M-16]
MNQCLEQESNRHYQHRNNCRLCLSTDIPLAIPFAPTPIAEKYVSDPKGVKTPLFPVDLYMCNNCGHVQILDVIDPEYLWADYTYHSGQTQGIIDHFNDVSQQILGNFGPFSKKFVIDVGSNDGTFLKCFKSQGFKVLGIDPATEIAAKATSEGVETIADLMTEARGQQIQSEYGQADLVTAFNVFAHADEMIDLLKGIVKVLDKDGLFVFEVSYLKDIIDKMLIGTIFHEHLCNHSLKPMIAFLAAQGLEVFDVEHVSIQGGSIIGFAQHKNGPREIKPSVAAMVEAEDKAMLHELATMEQFVSRFDAMKQQVRETVQNTLDKGGVVAGYGAARSGPMLLTQYEIGSDVSEVYDDHKQKVGLFTPGDLIQVKPTQTINETQPELTVILAWIHAKAIVRKHEDYLQNGGQFLTLTPTVQLINKDNYANFIA